MNLTAFQTLRSGLQRHAAPASTQVRKVLETGLREELLSSGCFEDVEVGGCEDADRLVVALGTYLPGVTDSEVEAVVLHAWSRLAFHHWEAHAFLTEDGHVELQAATLDRPNGRFVSVHLVARRSEVAALEERELVVAMPHQRYAEAPVLARSA